MRPTNSESIVLKPCISASPPKARRSNKSGLPAGKLVGQQLLDVRAAPKDTLQVDPSSLHVHPKVEDNADLVEPILRRRAHLWLWPSWLSLRPGHPKWRPHLRMTCSRGTSSWIECSLTDTKLGGPLSVHWLKQHTPNVAAEQWPAAKIAALG